MNGAPTAAAPAAQERWLTPGVRGIGTASLLADLGHEVPTALLPSWDVLRISSQCAGNRLLELSQRRQPASVR